MKKIVFALLVTITLVSCKKELSTSNSTIDSTKVNPAKVAAVEDILYGSDGTGGGNTGTVARLPLPTELFQILGVTTNASTTTTTTTSHA